MSGTVTRPRPRIESLSDLIFGLALSIGAISLIGNPPLAPTQLYNDLISFAFSFLILISVWIRYTQIMSVLPLENRRTIFLNIVLLFCVSIEPFLFNLLSARNLSTDSPDQVRLVDSASQLYAVDLGAMMLILGFFTYLIASEERKLIASDLIKQFKLQSYAQIISGALFFVTVHPIFWNTVVLGSPLRFDFWAVPAVMIWIRRGYRRISKQAEQSGEG